MGVFKLPHAFLRGDSSSFLFPSSIPHSFQVTSNDDPFIWIPWMLPSSFSRSIDFLMVNEEERKPSALLLLSSSSDSHGKIAEDFFLLLVVGLAGPALSIPNGVLVIDPFFPPRSIDSPSRWLAGDPAVGARR